MEKISGTTAGRARIGRRGALAALGGLLTAAPALAQDFPTRPIRLIVPWAPGALVDNTARILADTARPFLGQPIIVENKPGASGTIAAAEVARSTPDGYTLLVANASQMTIAPLVQRNLPFNPTTDLVPVIQLAEEYEMLVGNKNLPANTLQELVAYLRARPGEVNFSSAGVGSVTHLLGEMFRIQANVDIVHIPFRGAAPAVQGVLSGDVSLTFASVSSTRALAASGQLKIYGISASRRSRWLPEVPTLQEGGVPGVVVPFWVGLVAPARTPAPVLAALRNGLNRALHASEVLARFEQIGIEVTPAGSEEFAAMMTEEAARWRALLANPRVSLQ
jgi:tripartite-type tricarboxylate transporter receptor subunit TctC